MNKIITSFGSAFISPDEKLFSEITEIGKYIAEAGYNICSGGYYGSMEAISKGAKSAGGKTIGVTVKGWEAAPNDFVDEIAEMPNLMERIVELIGIADAYIIFKGGTGTLLEISATLELMNKKAIAEKKMIFYTDFWKNMIEILKQDSDKLSVLIERNVFFITEPGQIKILI
ncbi:MAG: LOG family protein [Ignavibacteria bacterium]|nr:LOG family protein [Ignavibacteria bacterium]